jgi:hypothetical protein
MNNNSTNANSNFAQTQIKYDEEIEITVEVKENLKKLVNKILLDL